MGLPRAVEDDEERGARGPRVLSQHRDEGEHLGEARGPGMATGKGSGRRAVGIGVRFQGTKDGGFGCVGSRLGRDPVEVQPR